MSEIVFKRSDENPGAVLNVDNAALAAYKKQRKLFRDLSSQEQRIQKIETNIDEIKTLLTKLIENGK